MTTCENDHERIAHDEFHCPLCAEREDYGEVATGTLQDRISDLEAQLDTLKRSVRGVAYQTTQDAIARADKAEQDLLWLKWEVRQAIEHPATKTAILDRLTKAYYRVEAES